MEGKRITAEMIAPCGLDCSLCKRALAETDPCPGCHGTAFFGKEITVYDLGFTTLLCDE